MKAIELYLPIATPSLNVRKREHWGATKTWRERWGRMLLPEIMRNGGKEALRATGKRIVTIERHGKRALDDDNRFGGAKELVDEIRAAGLIIDDSTRHAELRVIDVPLGRGMKPHTIVRIEREAK